MKLLIIAGEVSGDIHGAKLISQLRSLSPSLEVKGIGGQEMINEGLHAYYNISELLFLGIGEIIKHLPFIKKVFNNLAQKIKSDPPDAIILIDYPGFNLRMARFAKGQGISVIYYISPQLWAWGKGRVKKIRRYVDLMLVIFPFEVAFYNQYGITAHYVGHPLVDTHFENVEPKDPEKKSDNVLGLLPGSRRQELDSLLPNMIATARILLKENKIQKVFIFRVDHLPESLYTDHFSANEAIEIFHSNRETIYNNLDVALVSSGTATLETAYFQVPLVIVYKVGLLTWNLGKLLVRLKNIGLANIVAGQPVAPELLQKNFKPEIAAQELTKLLQPEINLQVRKKLKIIQEKLGKPGASKRTAEQILQFIQLRT